MNEIKNIINQYQKLKQEGIRCILATVVRVEGSSYRREGARMLTDEFGNLTGAISGGCLEGDALKKALLALHKNTKKLVTYDTSDESDAVIGAQLGCNGIIKVLFEPVDYTNSNNVIEILKWVVERKEGAFVMVHITENGESFGTLNAFAKNGLWMTPPEIMDISYSDSDLLLNHSYYKNVKNDSSQVFFNFIKPKIHLVITGAGNDVVILQQLAEVLGWQVSILDGRHTHASKERFGENCQIFLGNADEVLNCIQYPQYTAVLLMSHNFQYDLKALARLITLKELPYIGILGPKKKYLKMQEALQDQGIQTNDDFDNIFSPMGFDIGAETPAEIALSVLAEIQSVFNGKSGASLKYKSGRIHKDHV